MTTLQDFKSHLVPGAKCTFTAKWCPTPTIRTVTRVKGGVVALSHPFKTNSDSGLTMPKATEVSQPAPGCLVIRFTDMIDQALTYDFRNVATVPA